MIMQICNIIPQNPAEVDPAPIVILLNAICIFFVFGGIILCLVGIKLENHKSLKIKFLREKNEL